MPGTSGDTSHAGLIGRERELALSERLRAEAAAGTPRLLLLRGEAGIGKSHLARVIARAAAADGATTLWGGAHEDVSIPYLPIATALAPVLEGDPAGELLLDPAGGSAGGGIPELRLWSAIANRLLGAAHGAPLVLVLDDLQWADTASLDLMLHLVTALTHAAVADPVRLLAVVTIRAPVAAERPARAIERLAREPGAIDLTLPGLDPNEVRELVLSIAHAAPSTRLLRAITESTAGNPLLIRSLVTRALERGQLGVRDGELINESGDELLADARDLDHAVRDRLQRVGERCRDLLTIAAFLGDDRPIAELAAASDDPATTEAGLAEAVRADLVEEHGGRYRFSHPQIRQVLYHGPQGRSRWQLHLRVADALERANGPGAALAAARHLAQAGPLADSTRLCELSSTAARHALAVGAWSEAARSVDVALDSLADDAAWTDRCDLHIAGTWAAFHDFDGPAVRSHAEVAIGLARAHGDTARWSDVLHPYLRSSITNASSSDQLEPAVAEVRSLLASGEDTSAATAQVEALLAEALAHTGDADGARQHVRRASALVSDDTEPAAASHIWESVGLVALFDLDLDASSDAYRRSIRHANRLGDDPWRGVAPANRLVLLRYLAGDLPGADEDAAARLIQLRRFQLWAEHSFISATTASIALARGRFGDVERYGREARLLLRRSGYTYTPGILFPALAQGRALRGDATGAHSAIDEWEGLGLSGSFRYRQAIDVLTGEERRVADEVRRRPWPAPPSEPDLVHAPVVLLQAEVAAAIDDPVMAAATLPGLHHLHRRGVRLLPGWTGLVSRAAAQAAATAGDEAEGARWLDLATNEAAVGDLRPEAARILLARAPLEPTATVRQQIATAATEALDRLGLLSLGTTARRVSSDVDVATSPPPPATRTIVFTDLVDSTALNVRVGDAAWLELMREHDRVLRARLRDHDGVEFKHTGDGLAAWFASAPAAIECVAKMTDDLERGNAVHPDAPLRIRAGLAAGEPVGEGPDLFGLAVVRAARVCALATAGQVLVAEEVAELAGHDARLVLESVGPRPLKGFPEAVHIYAASLVASTASAASAR